MGAHEHGFERLSVTPQTITDWNKTITDYKQVQLLPNDKLKTRKQINAQIDALVKQGLSLRTETLDSAAIGFTTNGNMDFFNGYTERRLLVPKGTRHGKFRILVLDDLNQPVPYVELRQDKTDNKTVTGLEGMASLDIIYNKTKNKNIADPYSFTLTSGSKTINNGWISIKRNETESRVYYLEPAGFVVPAFEPEIITVTEPV